VLAEEQAALRRVATLVACQPSPAQVFAAVTEAAVSERSRNWPPWPSRTPRRAGHWNKSLPSRRLSRVATLVAEAVPPGGGVHGGGR
jgi:hypothetical protein